MCIRFKKNNSLIKTVHAQRLLVPNNKIRNALLSSCAFLFYFLDKKYK